jgi:hypothetical protein
MIIIDCSIGSDIKNVCNKNTTSLPKKTPFEFNQLGLDGSLNVLVIDYFLHQTFNPLV